MNRTLRLLPWMWLCTLPLWAQSPALQPLPKKLLPGIRTEQLGQYLQALTSPAFAGRETGTAGQHLSAHYLSAHLQSCGLRPLQDSTFLQSFQLYSVRQGGCLLHTASDTLHIFQDAYPLSPFQLPRQQLPVCFVGAGSPKEIQNKNLAGKAVLLLDQRWKQGPKELREVLGQLREQGAALVLLLGKDDGHFSLQQELTRNNMGVQLLGFDGDRYAKALGIIAVKATAWARLCGQDPTTLQQQLEDYKPDAPPSRMEAPLLAEASLQRDTLHAENAIGMLEGTHPQEKAILLSAHYDHLGKLSGDAYYPGADDNGSGTAALMAMAEALGQAARRGERPRRSIILIAFSGEEKGLLGSLYYTAHPLYPLERTMANLNVDMVGRSDNRQPDPQYLYLIGSDRRSTALRALAEATAMQLTPKLRLDYHYDSPQDPQQFFYRSDHYRFAERGIPVTFFFNGLHPDYHQPTDTADKIDLPSLRLRAQLILALAWQLASLPQDLPLDRPLPSE